MIKVLHLFYSYFGLLSSRLLTLIFFLFLFSPDRINVLANLLFQKTRGNPFFLCQLLRSITNEEYVKYNYQTHEWEWSIEELSKVQYPFTIHIFFSLFVIFHNFYELLFDFIKIHRKCDRVFGGADQKTSSRGPNSSPNCCMLREQVQLRSYLGDFARVYGQH